jgi:hypothetical protein
MAADFVPKAKREGLNILADLANTKIEYPFLSLHDGQLHRSQSAHGQSVDSRHVRIDSRAPDRHAKC